MSKCEERIVEPEKKPYEEPTLVEREDLLQVTEGFAAGISGVPLPPPPPP